MKQFLKNYWALFIPVVILLIALYYLMKSPAENTKQPIGMVDASYVDVAAEFPGRLDSLLVHEGDTVRKGQLLGVLRTTEIDAIRKQALAAIEAAESQVKLLEKGARPELVQSAGKLYKIAQDQYDLAQKTFQRMERLYNDSVVSGQEKDIIYFKYQAAKKEMEIARLNQQMLEKGTQPEIVQTATAILKQAQQGYELTKALTDNTRIYAPADGIISSLITHEGEIVSIGYPMMTLQKDNSYILRFNIRQDLGGKFPVGAVTKATVPGCTPEQFDVRVSTVSPSLDFANWVPTSDKGKFEMKTFTIEFKPVDLSSIKGLRPGMTAAIAIP
ncbi:HlyD family secretion protein [Chitinophaga skermanii]|uniref:HlyD family secretion protein n=1 Tax=Chitinophaga skermanii TaxID=331697 RepID=A0A327QVL4_9BACT|nr:efflux RND transporter periplasmic adaptor subunit [Chitinophaga skermanii]RAJ08420.1 HlyD family secretion protein [Chitinophaga skermanii]